MSKHASFINPHAQTRSVDESGAGEPSSSTPTEVSVTVLRDTLLGDEAGERATGRLPPTQCCSECSHRSDVQENSLPWNRANPLD